MGIADNAKKAEKNFQLLKKQVAEVLVEGI